MTLEKNDIRNTIELSEYLKAEATRYPISDILLGIPNSTMHAINLSTIRWIDCKVIARELNIVYNRMYDESEGEFQDDEFANLIKILEGNQ